MEQKSSGGEIRNEFYKRGFPGLFCFFVTKNTNQLLGKEWMEQLPPISNAFEAICCKIEEKPSKAEPLLVSQLQKQFPMVFKEELGHCRKKKAALVVKAGARPTFCRLRKTNTTHYDCYYYDHMQERNPFGQPDHQWIIVFIRNIQ